MESFEWPKERDERGCKCPWHKSNVTLRKNHKHTKMALCSVALQKATPILWTMRWTLWWLHLTRALRAELFLHQGQVPCPCGIRCLLVLLPKLKFEGDWHAASQRMRQFLQLWCCLRWKDFLDIFREYQTSWTIFQPYRGDPWGTGRSEGPAKDTTQRVGKLEEEPHRAPLPTGPHSKQMEAPRWGWLGSTKRDDLIHDTAHLIEVAKVRT